MRQARTGPVGVISNPGSGHNRDQFPAIRERLEDCPSIVHTSTASADDIASALSTMRDAGIAVLAINGGDGTTSAILGQMLESRFFEQPPLIAILPGGTANMNAGDVGVRGSLQSAVKRFCQWCESDRSTAGRLQRRSLLRVDDPGSETTHYGMFMGAGAVMQGTEYAHREIHSRGLRDDFSLALGVLRTVWGVLRDDPQFNQHVEIALKLDDGQSARHDALILAISTLERLAFGMRPFWSEQAGALRLTLMEQGCTRFARTFLSIVRGKPNSNAIPAAGYHSYNADLITLELEGQFNLDGELITPNGPLQLSASEPLEFLKL